MMRSSYDLRVIFSILFCAAIAAADNGDLEEVDFARDVRPILSDKCFACHGPDQATRKSELRLDTPEGALKGGRSGFPALVPGDREESELWALISTEFDEERMPPLDGGKELSDDEIETIGRWIDEGAPWAEHWSFLPPRRQTPSGVEGEDWSQGAVDDFLLKEMRSVGFEPEVRASKEKLLRRASFDLTGLAPTLEELDAFLADVEPGAWQRVLDRLFASSRYGEHMARYWLDAARYGDTHGLHLDSIRSMWLYREWVIRAFNENKPFDEFTVEQLAGDLLEEPTQDQLVATGFNRCNVTTAEGGLIAEEYLVHYAFDRVDTTSTVWMGMTMRCAKCHDHKFDPFSQKEYYEMMAFFRGLAEEASDGNAIIAAPAIQAATPQQEARYAELEETASRLSDELNGPLTEVDALQASWEQERGALLREHWRTLSPTSQSSEKGSSVSVEAGGVVQVSGENPATDVHELLYTTELEGIRSLHFEGLPDSGNVAGGLGRSVNGNVVMTGFELEAAPMDPDAAFEPVAISSVKADFSQASFPVSNVLVQGSDTGWAIHPQVSDRHELSFVLEEPLQYEGGARLRLHLRYESVHAQHVISRFRLSAAAMPELLPAAQGPWMQAGPFFTATSAEAKQTEFIDPSAPLDVSREAQADGVEADSSPLWVSVPHEDGVIQRYEQKIGAVYLARTIRAASSRKYEVRLGSDDGIWVWLNGAQVYANDVARGVAADQDNLTLDLLEGQNDLLIKIVNAGGGFGSYYRLAKEEGSLESAELVEALLQPDDERSESVRLLLRDHYRATTSPGWRELKAEVTAAVAERDTYKSGFAQTMIMRERETPRPTHMLMRGQYDQPGELVHPGVPAIFNELPESSGGSRLDLAQWLVDPSHPLTSRVMVNRLWQQLFGTGIVKTAEDFGVQGEWPSHPELLDWLSVEFIESGWDVQHMLRLMMSSAAYQQDSKVAPAKQRYDPENRPLARGPNHRLDAEVIRDSALASSGLLVEKLGGESVKPYQPLGIWKAVGYTSSNTANFKQDSGDALYRRSLYTFWKRTAPPPTLTSFDAPSREECCVRRERTNTPLQALVLLNDVQHVEAARVFAARLLDFKVEEDGRLRRAFRMATSRTPDTDEIEILSSLLSQQRSAFAADVGAAEELISVGDSAVAERHDASELAAWTVVASAVMNLHEAITKG